jgi:hypothetical protein
VEVYACLSYLPSPHTFFGGIHKLPPASCLLWQDGRWSIHTYWDLPPVDEANLRTDAAAVESEFARLFADSVRIRMRSDVPYGAFLSGGLDSSCVVAAMARLSPHPVETFTIGFARAHFDERLLARQVAEAFGTAHHEETVEPEVFEASLAQVMHHYDEPFGDASAIPTGAVSRAARRHFRLDAGFQSAPDREGRLGRTRIDQGAAGGSVGRDSDRRVHRRRDGPLPVPGSVLPPDALSPEGLVAGSDAREGRPHEHGALPGSAYAVPRSSAHRAARADAQGREDARVRAQEHIAAHDRPRAAARATPGAEEGPATSR